MEYIEVTIRRPLFKFQERFFVYIRDKYLKQAKRKGKLLKINVPEGSAYYSYDEWMKGCRRMEQVFRFPDRPLKLIGNYLEISHGVPSTNNYVDTMIRLGKVFKKKYGKKVREPKVR